MAIHPEIFASWKEISIRDDWHRYFVGSDIRVMLGEIDNLTAALMKIERIGWREGTKFQEWLLECRAIARDAVTHEQSVQTKEKDHEA